MLRRSPAIVCAVVACCSGMADVTWAQAATATRPPGREISVGTVGQRDAGSRSSLERLVTVAFANVRLDVAIDQLAAAAKVTIVYTDRVLPVTRIVSDTLVRVPLGDALRRVLRATGVVARESKDGRVILGSATVVPAGAGSVVGLVKDTAMGLGLVGVEISLDGTRWHTKTDTTGWYRLAAIDTGTYTLIARKIGYGKRSHRVTIREGREDTVDVVLTPLAIKLNELVTTATGQQRRRDLGNAITTIRADSVLQSAPIRNLTDLLENRVPGLTMQRTTGAPGDPSRLRLRGIGSVLRGNDPIVIVDGIRIYSAQSEARSGNLTNLGCPDVEGVVNSAAGVIRCGTTPIAGVAGDLPAPSPLDQIDPNIIETIEVFKGPSAATLYGADAANGVIVITTKRGKPGPTRWQARVTHRRTVTPGRWPDAYFRWGHVPEWGGAPRICAIIDSHCQLDSLVRTQTLNEPDLTILGQGQETALSLSASGGNQALTYSITGTYDDQGGLLKLPDFEAERFRTAFNREAPDWMRRPHHLKKWSVTSNVTTRLNKAADVRLFATVSRSDQQRSNLERKVAVLAGTYVDRVNGRYYRPSSGTATVFRIGDFVSSGGPLLSPTFLQDYYTKVTASEITFTTGLGGNWTPRSWFRAHGQASLDVKPRNDDRLQPFGMPTAADSGALIRGNGRSLVSTFNLQGTVRKPLGWGFNFETSVGTNLTMTNTADLVSSAAGLVPGTSTITNARFVTVTEHQANTSVFGWYIEPRIVGERLSLSTGFRLDGGSAYGTRLSGAGGGGLALPKLNGSWVISEEPFFPFNGLFSSLRLRAAYGQAQVQPDPVSRLRIYTGRLDDRLLLATIGNTDLRPERSTEFEGGFDADLLDARVSVELTTYQKTQVDALMPVQLAPSINGGGTVIQNIGNIRNRGLEVVVGLTPVQSPILTWSARLAYSRNSNTLVKLGAGVLPSKEQGLVEGYPVGGRWARPILGYADQNGNEVLEPGEVQVGDSLLFMGRLLPDYAATLFTDITLFGGAVGISAGFAYESGAMQIDQTASTNWVLVRALSDPSTPLSEQAAVIASVNSICPNTSSTATCVGRTEYGLMQDLSTFRFNSFSVNYRAPDRVAQLLRAQRMSVGLQGSNLGLHSTYRGKDPNVNSWSPGESITDTGQLPQPRTWQVGLSLTY